MKSTASATYINECLTHARYYVNCSEPYKALAILKPFWSDLEEIPNTEGLTVEQGCELLLIAGNVLSFYGNIHLKKDYQEKAENILTVAREMAIDDGSRENIAKAEKEMAIAYWRTGSYENAIAYCNSALSHFSELEQRTNVTCLLTKTNLIMLYARVQQFNESVELVRELSLLVPEADNLWLNMVFNSQAGAFYMVAGQFKKSVPFLERAVEYSQINKNHTFQGYSLNNLANAYVNIPGEAARAETYINTALEHFAELENQFSYAVGLETKTQILLAQDKLKEALCSIDESIKVLEKGENYADLCNSLWVKIQVLAKIGERNQAIYTFVEILSVCRTHLSKAISDGYIEKFNDLFYLQTGGNLYQKVENFQRHLLSQALVKGGGLVLATARQLGISHQNTKNYLMNFPDLIKKFDVKFRTRGPNAQLPKRKDQPRKLIAVEFSSNRLEYLGMPAGSILNIQIVRLDELDFDRPVAVKDSSGEFDCGFLLQDFGMYAFGDGRGEIERCYMTGDIVECGQIVEVFDHDKGVFVKIGH